MRLYFILLHVADKFILTFLKLKCNWDCSFNMHAKKNKVLTDDLSKMDLNSKHVKKLWLTHKNNRLHEWAFMHHIYILQDIYS